MSTAKKPVNTNTANTGKPTASTKPAATGKSAMPAEKVVSPIAAAVQTLCSPAKKTFTFHPAAALFPEPSQQTLAEIKSSILSQGQIETIKIYRDQILDGRCRYTACIEAGIEPRVEYLEITDKQVLQYIAGCNLHRRHLSDAQRAMVAAKIATMQRGGNQYSEAAITQGEAAAMMKVSPDSLQRANKVLATGVPELQNAVIAGHLDVANAALIAVLPADLQTEVVAKGEKEIVAMAKTLNKAKKAAKRQEHVKNLEAIRANNKPLLATGKKYELILADVPWPYLGEGGVPYPTMTIQEICAMPVKERAADNAVLFFWVPASQIFVAKQILEAWGFEYKTCAVWKKGASGQGPYFRINHEILMLATRGQVPAVLDGTQPEACFEEARTTHSTKPERSFEMIEQMYPELTKLELFRRGEPRAGWDGWGNQCDGGIDVLPVAAAANDPAMPDIVDELMAAVGMAVDNPAPVSPKRAA